MECVRELREFLSRVVRVAVEDPRSSRDTKLVAELLCGVADGDVFVIDGTVEHIRARDDEDPFEHIQLATSPFNILHFAALAPLPASMAHVISNERFLERLAPVDAGMRSQTAGRAAGATPLHIAAALGHLPHAKILLAAGANPRALRQQRITVLHDAVCSLEKKIAPFLPMHEMSNRLSRAGEGTVTPSDAREGASLSSTLTSAKHLTPTAAGSAQRSVFFSSAFHEPSNASSPRRWRQAGSSVTFGGEQLHAASAPLRTSSQGTKGDLEEQHRTKFLHGLPEFLLCVLLLGRGCDPDIQSVPGAFISEDARLLLAEVSREVKRRMQDRQSIGMEVVRQAHTTEARRKLRPEESSRPSHSLFIREVIAFRCHQSHQQRMEAAAVLAGAARGTVGARRSLPPIASMGQLVIANPFSELIPPRLTKRMVELRMEQLRRREAELAGGSIPAALRLKHSPSFAAPPMQAIPSIARLRVLSPPSFVEAAAMPPDAAQRHLVDRPGLSRPHLSSFGSMTMSRSGFDGKFREVASLRTGTASHSPGASPHHGSAAARMQGEGLRTSSRFASFRSIRSTRSLSTGSWSSSEGNPSNERGRRRSGASRRGSRHASTLLPERAPQSRRSLMRDVAAEDASGGSSPSSPRTKDMSQEAQRRAKRSARVSAAFKCAHKLTDPSTICGEVLFVGALPRFRWLSNWHQEQIREEQSHETLAHQQSLTGMPPPPLLPIARDDPAGHESRDECIAGHSSKDAVDVTATTQPGADLLSQSSITASTHRKLGAQTLTEIVDEHLGEEQLFLGLAVPPEHSNCDGVYLGDGKRYFVPPRGLGGLFVPLSDVTTLTSTSDIALATNRLRRVALEHLSNERDRRAASTGAPTPTRFPPERAPSGSTSLTPKPEVRDWGLIAREAEAGMRRCIAQKKARERDLERKIREVNLHYLGRK